MPAAAPTTKAPAAPIFTQTGSAVATTGSFKLPSRWDFQWCYDCTGTFGGTRQLLGAHRTADRSA
jgi:hypothetical protein